MCTCTETDLVFPPEILCHGEEGLFPRCAELAAPSSKAGKARTTSEEFRWGIGRSISKTGCSLRIFLPPSYCSLRRRQFTLIHLLGTFPSLGETECSMRLQSGQKQFSWSPGTERGNRRKVPERPDFVLIKEGPHAVQHAREMLPPLMRQLLSVPHLPGDGWLDPVSEGFNLTKVMTLEMGKEKAPWVGFTVPGWFSQGAQSLPRSGDVHLTTSCHQGSQQLAQLPSTSLDRARSLHRTCTPGASTSLWVERNLPVRVCARVLFSVSGALGGETVLP